MELLPGQPENTVQIRVQVVDMQSFTLDLQVPNYLPARDLTQRVARDAGLNSYWPDGRRRSYWLRARGRLLLDDEKLQDLGVINNELVYLLPEPPSGAGVEEQRPDYPENKGYAGKGLLNLAGAMLGVMVWAAGWGFALTLDRGLPIVVLPGLAQGFLMVSFSRHLWGGAGSQARVAAVALLLYLLVCVLVFLPSVVGGEAVGSVYASAIPGFIAGIVGVLFGWLAWWGAVEPLPKLAPQAVASSQEVAVEVVPCGICGGGATPDVRCDCPHRCGQTFHKGCHAARVAVYRGDPRFCAVCNARVG